MIKADLLIRGGMLADGSGSPPIEADVAVIGDRIAAVGVNLPHGQVEIDARGKLVTPGFVDIHTHYDGHATWSDRLNPSSAHGVTTVVMGNCGVGFAPCRPQDREKLIQLMEGVEDIPGVAMRHGLPWDWEDFESYLAALERGTYDMDVAAQLPHAPLRVYVMGERALNREPASGEDVRRMREIARRAVLSGAMGFSTSRSLNHRASDGSLTPSYAAATAELVGIANGLKDAGRGVLQLISDFDDVEGEFEIVRSMVGQSKRPLSLSLMQFEHAPRRWAEILERIEQANGEGMEIRAQVCGRPVGVLAGLKLSFNPFYFCPSYAAVAALPLDKRIAALRDPSLRSSLVAEFPGESWQPIAKALANLENLFVFGDQPDYEPRRENSITAQAASRGQPAVELAYDMLIADEGRNIFYLPAANYVDFTPDVMETLLRHPLCVLGLGDGGAHCGTVCDASLPTYMLARWARVGDGRGLPIGQVVRQLTLDTARTVGLCDRGRIAPGLRADINVIDMNRIALLRPEMVADLPGGFSRLHQKARGYDATIMAGQITYRGGEATGALPGRLVRGAQSAGRLAT